MTTASPRLRAASTSATFVTPQSQVMTRPTPRVGQRREAASREPVAVRPARRNVADRVRSQRPQGEDPDGHRAHAVGIVVTPDRDPLPRLDSVLDPVERSLRIGHQLDRMQRGSPVEEIARGPRGW